MKKFLPDVLIGVGGTLAGYGVYMIYPPAGVICWGVMLVASAVILIRGGD